MILSGKIEISKMYLITTTLVNLTVILVLLYFYIKKKFRYWADRGVPFLEPEIPFGNIRGLNSKISLAEFTENAYKKLKGKGILAGLYFYTKPVLFPLDLDLIKNILVKDFHCFSGRGWYVNKEADLGTGSLFQLDGQGGGR